MSWIRARRIAVSASLGAFTLFALRMAFVPLGDAVTIVVQHRPGDLLVAGVELLVYLMAAMIAAGAIVRRRPDGATWAFIALAILAVCALGFAPRYLARLGPPPARTFHGIYTPGSDWTDFSAARPRLEYHVNRFGFRRMLIVNALLAACLMSALSLVTIGTPQAVIMALIFTGGFFRSLEFTTLATMSYADVERARMSKATTVSSMFQQISMSFGVAVAAGLLHVLPILRGHEVTNTSDFAWAFMIVGILSGTSALVFHA